MKLLPVERAKEIVAIPLIDLREHEIKVLRAKCKHQFQPLRHHGRETTRKARCLVCGKRVWNDMRGYEA